METSEDFQENIDLSRQIQQNEEEIIKYKYQLAKLNEEMKLTLIPLLYGSVVEYFFDSVVAVNVNRFIEEGYALSPDIIEQVKLLREKIQREYENANTENMEETDILLNDLIAFQNSMVYFFNEFKRYNIIQTNELLLVPYLQNLFNSNPSQFKQLIELIEQKIQQDNDIEALSSQIYTMEEQNIVLEDPQQLTPRQMQQSQQTSGEGLNVREKTNHLFVLVCHGNSVSQFKNYFKTRSYFKNIEFIAPFGEILYGNLDSLDERLKNSPSQTQNASQVQVQGDVDTYLDEYRITHGPENYRSNEVIVSNEQYAYLPPMVFTPVTENMDQDLVEKYNKVMGLYHYALFEGTYYLVDIVADYNELKRNIIGEYLTYSSISSLTRKYFKSIKNGTRQIDQKFEKVEGDIKDKSEKELFENTSITFFSCRYYLYGDLILNEDVLQFFNSTVVFYQEPKEAIFFSEFEKDQSGNNDDRISLFTVDLSNFDIMASLQRWQGALVSLYHQGCGVNILSFYELMGRLEAQGRASCINIGTSIFKIADYIVKNNPQYFPNQGFGVTRMPLKSYLMLISNIMNNSVSQLSMTSTFVNTNYLADMAFIFRIYESNLQKDGKTYNEVGHFVSICVKDDTIHFIDPQQSLLEVSKYYIDFSGNNYVYQFLEGVLSEYYPSYQFCDFYIYKNNISPLSFNELEREYGGVLRQRSAKLSFGGRKKRAKGKKTLKKRAIQPNTAKNKDKRKNDKNKTKRIKAIKSN